ncbi:MAG: aldehyde dehydrogenase family protein, partial [Rhodobiaceae bacterium]
IMANASDTIKHVSLELGGKAPALVFDDADLDRSVAEIRRGVLALNGQMCTCISRILVQDSVYDSMKQRLTQAFTAVKIGDASAAGTELGPIIDRANQQRLATIIDRAADQARMVVHGGVGQ